MYFSQLPRSTLVVRRSLLFGLAVLCPLSSLPRLCVDRVLSWDWRPMLSTGIAITILEIVE